MNELRIGICDDKVEVVRELKEMLTTILKKNEDKYGLGLAVWIIISK